MTDMLIEFESLDAEDVKHIMNNTWNTDKKRGKLKKADELQKQMPSEVPPPPPKPQIGDKLALDGE